jgi:hypothetical protein
MDSAHKSERQELTLNIPRSMSMVAPVRATQMLSVTKVTLRSRFDIFRPPPHAPNEGRRHISDEGDKESDAIVLALPVCPFSSAVAGHVLTKMRLRTNSFINLNIFGS